MLCVELRAHLAVNPPPLLRRVPRWVGLSRGPSNLTTQRQRQPTLGGGTGRTADRRGTCGGVGPHRVGDGTEAIPEARGGQQGVREEARRRQAVAPGGRGVGRHGLVILCCRKTAEADCTWWLIVLQPFRHFGNRHRAICI